MSNRFKHLGIGTAIALLLVGQQATAQAYDSSPCRDWEIGAHALYLTPISCPYAYASLFTTVVAGGVIDTNGQAQLVPCRADWGFRAFGNYVGDCVFVGLSYQWFEVTTTRSIVAVAPQLLRIPGGGNARTGRATGQVGIEYQNVNVRVGKYLRRGCDSTLYLYGNARWVDLSHRRSARIVYTVPINLVRAEEAQEKSQLEGGALGIGFGGDIDVWCGVGAFIDGNVLGVIGRRSLRNVRFRGSNDAGAIATAQKESYPSETCVIPEVEFRIGVNYTYACGCWKLVGEIGYEVDYFWHASAFPELVGFNLVNNPQNFVPVCEDLGFSGLFFGARLIF